MTRAEFQPATSDRFLSAAYTEQTYTKTGVDWIADNTMGSVPLRHHPELRPALARTRNAFTRWKPAG
jgi:hypothetical protein